MKQHYMLPNRFQKTGWILVALTPVVFGLGFLAFYTELIANSYSRYLTMICYMLLFAGVFMVILSKEKEEDEMIRSIRRSSVSLTAIITFVLYIGISLTIAFVDGFRILRFPEIYKIHSMISNIMTPLLIYFVIFRGSIWRMRRQCKEDQA